MGEDIFGMGDPCMWIFSVCVDFQHMGCCFLERGVFFAWDRCVLVEKIFSVWLKCIEDIFGMGGFLYGDFLCMGDIPPMGGIFCKQKVLLARKGCFLAGK